MENDYSSSRLFISVQLTRFSVLFFSFLLYLVFSSSHTKTVHTVRDFRSLYFVVFVNP